eukprot:15347730-Ditylum_brightwellii.AAC.1
MANDQQTSGKHKMIQNTRSISKASTPSVKKKLSKTVEYLAGLQQGFPKGTVELLEEKSLQKPPANTTALTLADGGTTEEIEWTTVNNTGKLANEIDEAYKQSKEKPASSTKRKEQGNSNIITTPILERRKRFHPMPYQTKQAPKASEEKDYLNTAEQIKLQ